MEQVISIYCTKYEFRSNGIVCEFYKPFPSAGRNKYFHCWLKGLPVNIWNKQTNKQKSWIHCLLSKGDLYTICPNKENRCYCVAFGDLWCSEIVGLLQVECLGISWTLTQKCHRGTEAVVDWLTFRSMVPAVEMSLIAWDSFKTGIFSYGQRIISDFLRE